MDADVIVVGAGLAGLVATAELADAGKQVLLVDQEPENYLGGQAFWSLGGLMFVEQPRAAPDARQGLLRAGAAGLAGHGRLRPARGRVAAQVGRGLRGLLRRREALVAARPGHALDPQPGLARARRLPRRRARQLGAALPHNVGNRARGGGAVRAPGARGGRPRCGPDALSPPGRRTGRRRRRRDRRGGQDADRQRHRARGPDEPRGEWRLRPVGPGGGAHHRRHRRQSRPGAREVAEAAGQAAGEDALGRARARGRADAGHRPRRRRQRDQRRPHVALRGGHPQLGPDLAPPCHPDHPRAVVAVVRRHRQAPAWPALPGLRHARHAGAHPADRPRLHVVRAHREDHREGVRAVGLRAEPRHHLEEHQGRAQGPRGQRPARAGAGVQGPRRGLHRRALRSPSWCGA